MGAWAVDNFGNDEALDWLDEFISAPSAAALKATFVRVDSTSEEDYLESPDCTDALAAAEIVAALAGKPCIDAPKKLTAWIATRPAIDVMGLVLIARSALARIERNSELQELWADSKNNDAWLAVIADLRTRLG